MLLAEAARRMGIADGDRPALTVGEALSGLALRSVVRGRVASFASTSGLAVQSREGHVRDI